MFSESISGAIWGHTPGGVIAPISFFFQYPLKTVDVFLNKFQ